MFNFMICEYESRPKEHKNKEMHLTRVPSVALKCTHAHHFCGPRLSQPFNTENTNFGKTSLFRTKVMISLPA